MNANKIRRYWVQNNNGENAEIISFKNKGPSRAFPTECHKYNTAKADN